MENNTFDYAEALHKLGNINYIQQNIEKPSKKDLKGPKKTVRTQSSSSSSTGSEISESSTKKEDSVNSCESILKIFSFESREFTVKNQKCLEFWKMIDSRPDLKPINCVIIDSKSNKRDAECQTECEESEASLWVRALCELRKRNAHHVALLASGKTCDLCKLPEDTYEPSEAEDFADIEDLDDFLFDSQRSLDSDEAEHLRKRRSRPPTRAQIKKETQEIIIHILNDVIDKAVETARRDMDIKDIVNKELMSKLGEAIDKLEKELRDRELGLRCRENYNYVQRTSSLLDIDENVFRSASINTRKKMLQDILKDNYSKFVKDSNISSTCPCEHQKSPCVCKTPEELITGDLPKQVPYATGLDCVKLMIDGLQNIKRKTLTIEEAADETRTLLKSIQRRRTPDGPCKCPLHKINVDELEKRLLDRGYFKEVLLEYLEETLDRKYGEKVGVATGHLNKYVQVDEERVDELKVQGAETAKKICIYCKKESCNCGNPQYEVVSLEF